MVHNQRLRLGLLIFVFALGVPALLFGILTGGNPFTIGGLALTLISCALGLFQLTRERGAVRSDSSNDGPTLGKRHKWLFASIVVGLLLLPLLFLALQQLLSLKRDAALIIAALITVIVAWLIGMYGVRATN